MEDQKTDRARGYLKYCLTAIFILSLVMIGVILIPFENKRISRDRERKLLPVITAIDAFIKERHRLPTHNEFESDFAPMAWMLVLKNRYDPYAVSKGAKSDTDYMIGIWRADWYHYYKSWDKSFLNGYDERL